MVPGRNLESQFLINISDLQDCQGQVVGSAESPTASTSGFHSRKTKAIGANVNVPVENQ